MKKIATFLLSTALVFGLGSFAAQAFAAGNNGEAGPVAAKKKVTVAVIKAEWCSACKKVEPIMMELMQQYGDRIEFVMLDVSNDESTAQAAAKAKSLGLSNFFEANKKKTSTVGVFKSGRQTYVTAMNYNKSDYETAFNRALS